MIICLCRAKSHRDVLAAIEAGAGSIADLQRCGIGTDCGSCHGSLREMLAAHAFAAEMPFAAATAEERPAISPEVAP